MSPMHDRGGASDFGGASIVERGNDLRVASPPWWQVAGWSALVAFSVAHFLYSGVIKPWTTLTGDLMSAFPGPVTLRVSQAIPWMARDWVEPSIGWNNGPIPLMWNYGPVLHLIMLPFGLASSRMQAMQLILLFDYILLALTFALWIRLLFPGHRHPFAWVGILCIWLNYFPLLEALMGREIEIFELFLITIGLWLLRRKRQALAGLAFGFAMMTKFLPVVFIPYLFLKGYRRGGWISLVTVVTFAVGAQLVLGWQWSVTLALARREQAAAVFPTAYANQALSNVLYKTFTAFNINDPRPPTLYPYPLHAIGTALSAAVLLATAWFIVRWRRGRLLELESAFLAIVMCLLPSHANTYYFVFALPALSIGVAALAQRPDAFSASSKLALAGAIALMGFLVPMKVFEIATRIPGVLIARVLQGWSLPAYGSILAVGLMVELHRISRAGQPVLSADQHRV